MRQEESTIKSPTRPKRKPRQLPAIVYDISETARILCISERYLHQIKCKQLCPENKKLIRYLNQGKRIVFPHSEIQRYLRDEMRRQWVEK